MISIKQWKTGIHCNATIAPITNFTECLPLGICTNRVQITTRMKYMFPKWAIDLFLADRAGTRCPFKLSNISQIKNDRKKSTTFGDPLVSQLGQGCALTTYFCFLPTHYITSDVFSPTSSYNNSCALRGGVKKSE
jgi:hypothetical protein